MVTSIDSTLCAHIVRFGNWKARAFYHTNRSAFRSRLTVIGKNCLLRAAGSHEDLISQEIIRKMTFSLVGCHRGCCQSQTLCPPEQQPHYSSESRRLHQRLSGYPDRLHVPMGPAWCSKLIYCAKLLHTFDMQRNWCRRRAAHDRCHINGSPDRKRSNC